MTNRFQQRQELIAERYRLLSVLGRGGFAEVYLAEDTKLSNRLVALKVMANFVIGNEDRIKKFRQEAAIIAHLSSPNTVRCFDFGFDTSGKYYLAMEYIQGETLHSCLMKERKFETKRALRVTIQILDALEEAHQMGIIHRDLKPKNIMLTPLREREQVKVLDFGVARIVDQTQEYHDKEEWTLVGTATYMSPEQAQSLPLDPRSDIYSVGVILYHMLSGKPPFTTLNDPVAIMLHHTSKPVESLLSEKFKLKIPYELDRAVLKALEKDPSRRFYQAGQFRQHLERLLAQIEQEEYFQTTNELKKEEKESLLQKVQKLQITNEDSPFNPNKTSTKQQEDVYPELDETNDLLAKRKEHAPDFPTNQDFGQEIDGTFHLTSGDFELLEETKKDSSDQIDGTFHLTSGNFEAIDDTHKGSQEQFESTMNFTEADAIDEDSFEVRPLTMKLTGQDMQVLEEDSLHLVQGAKNPSLVEITGDMEQTLDSSESYDGTISIFADEIIEYSSPSDPDIPTESNPVIQDSFDFPDRTDVVGEKTDPERPFREKERLQEQVRKNKAIPTPPPLEYAGISPRDLPKDPLSQTAERAGAWGEKVPTEENIIHRVEKTAPVTPIPFTSPTRFPKNPTQEAFLEQRKHDVASQPPTPVEPSILRQDFQERPQEPVLDVPPAMYSFPPQHSTIQTPKKSKNSDFEDYLPWMLLAFVIFVLMASFIFFLYYFSKS